MSIYLFFGCCYNVVADSCSYKVVEPTADSNFCKIDSIISNYDYVASLSKLSEIVVKDIEKMPSLYLNNVIRKYKYYEVRELEGDTILDLGLPYPIKFEYDYAINIYANDWPRRSDYRLLSPEMWKLVMVKQDKIYLFSDFIENEIIETNNIIELPCLPEEENILLVSPKGTTWTFPIKNGKITGAFLTFHFGDRVVSPSIDLLNNTYIYPEFYLRKEVYEKLPYWNGQQ